jgi:hypothetical protein
MIENPFPAFESPEIESLGRAVHLAQDRIIEASIPVGSLLIRRLENVKSTSPGQTSPIDTIEEDYFL